MCCSCLDCGLSIVVARGWWCVVVYNVDVVVAAKNVGELFVDAIINAIVVCDVATSIVLIDLLMLLAFILVVVC